MRSSTFTGLALALLGAGFALPQIVPNPYVFFASYVILQYVAIATAWNILGGYAGYINFGASGFFGAGAYTAAFLFRAYDAPLAVQVPAALGVGACLGVAMGYLTLRIQGVYFAIATIALVVVLETLVDNIPGLGGARGLSILSPPPPAWFKGQVQLAFCVMWTIAIASVMVARWVERSFVGRGFRALRASEAAAESVGVPTLRLKLLACALSGGLIAAAAAPYPLYASYVEPLSVFNLAISVNALAMPLIGGTRSWLGPVIGASLLASIQQLATVTISSELNILVVGLLLILFVAIAPRGLLGLLHSFGKPPGRPA
jgi:branched-chain amino acid transport system permease protein